jgi:hypothetical protein
MACSRSAQPSGGISRNLPFAIDTQTPTVWPAALLVEEMNIRPTNAIPMIAGRMDPPWMLRIFMPEALQYRRLPLD